MTETIVKILVEVLGILAIATKEIKQGRPSESIHNNRLSFAHVGLEKYLKKLVGKNDMKDMLKRLDLLTQEEARMATAEVLKITKGINDKAKALIDGTQAI
jgi:hypothetical protein